MKTLLIISGGIQAADAAKRACEMGLRVVVSDMDPNAPGFAFAHDRLIADVYGPEATADVAERYHREKFKIDGVICVAADAPMTAALVAERLKLPGLSPATAKLACDKLAMKHRIKEKGVNVPWFAPLSSAAELDALVTERGRNLVIKPVDSRGSLGVQSLSRVADLKSAFDLARGHSPTKRVMVEAYLHGPRVLTQSIVTEARCYTPGFSHRNYEFPEVHAPFFIESGGDSPGHLPEAIQTKVKDLVARAAEALGVTNGTVKGDVVVHDGEPYVIELAARLSGGVFCTRGIPSNTGVDFIGCAIRVAMGETISPAELEPSRQQRGIQRNAFARPGRVVNARGADAAKRGPGLPDSIVTAKLSDISGDKRPSPAIVLATGKSREAASAVAALSASGIETR
jgi:biotin carboxylase